MVRVKEMSQGMIDIMQDGDFMLAVSNLEFADSPEEVEEIAGRVAEAGERHELSVDQMAVAMRLARAALLDQDAES